MAKPERKLVTVRKIGNKTENYVRCTLGNMETYVFFEQTRAREALALMPNRATAAFWYDVPIDDVRIIGKSEK